ncbi:39S ribosomal protein L9, mitochondrial [Halotydeus destructor]|nr:39S ribosomal protein L9, mitochondrial [Halotydeus destructor]
MNSVKLIKLTAIKNLGVQQTRNVWILRRRVQPPLAHDMRSPYIVGDYIKDIKSRPRPLLEKEQLLEVVEQTDCRKKPDIKVILLDAVEDLGVAGDVLFVNFSIARHELILSGRAVYASPFNLEYYKNLIDGKVKTTGPSSAVSRTTQKMLTENLFPIIMNHQNPWTIEKWHIRQSMRYNDCIVPDDAIELPQKPICGPDPGNVGKAFLVHVTINNQERAATRFVLHHSNLPLPAYWHCGQKQAIFEDEAETIKSMKVHDRPPEDVVEDFDD